MLPSFVFSSVLFQLLKNGGARLKRVHLCVSEVRPEQFNGLAYIGAHVKNEWVIVADKSFHIRERIPTYAVRNTRDFEAERC